MTLFSDRGARLRVGMALVLTVALGGYYARWALQAESGWRWVMEDPKGRDGETLVFPLWTVTRVVSPDRYEISKVPRDVPILGDATPLHQGDTVSVIGRFDASGPVVHEEVREIHVLRRWKEILGVVGFVWVAVWAPLAFRVRGGSLVERG